CCAAERSRSPMVIRAPSAAKALAVAAPMPLAPPVTTAVLPANLFMLPPVPRSGADDGIDQMRSWRAIGLLECGDETVDIGHPACRNPHRGGQAEPVNPGTVNVQHLCGACASTLPDDRGELAVQNGVGLVVQ